MIALKGITDLFPMCLRGSLFLIGHSIQGNFIDLKPGLIVLIAGSDCRHLNSLCVFLSLHVSLSHPLTHFSKCKCFMFHLAAFPQNFVSRKLSYIVMNFQNYIEKKYNRWFIFFIFSITVHIQYYFALVSGFHHSG